MSCPVWLYRGFLAVLLCAVLNGCVPSGSGRSEEENEPHFLAGKSCLNTMDYSGAIEEFEKALEVNPHSAAAHFQLGWLYEREPDPAAAIYHYQKYLQLRPNADNAEAIKQHISNCKLDLAKTAMVLPVSPQVQHQFEKLAEENKQLREQVEQWKTYAERLQVAQQQPAPSPAGSVSTPIQAPPQQDAQAVSPVPARETSARTEPTSRVRTHTVAAGDSLYGIAKNYGVGLAALKAANPGVDPRRLRVGQVLNLPAK